MNPISVIALFCQDIREEVGGLFTLIGIMPDNAEGHTDAEAKEGAIPHIPKICIYARLHFDPHDDIGPVKSELIFPNGLKREIDMFNAEVVAQAKKQSLDQGSPVVGIISRMEMVNFPVPENGRLQVAISIKGVTYIAGALNFKITVTSSSAPPLPSSQSRNGARKSKTPRARSRP